jgi:transcriptional regulator of acetoin/glycerol metabolism
MHIERGFRPHRAADIPEQYRSKLAGGNERRELLLSTLFSTKWNKSLAAQKLHWSRMTVYRKMAKYHLVPGCKV